jgi:hypothetical protein
MTKQQRIITLIERMEQNTFLLPDGWADTIHMATKDMSYRTYVGTRGIGRYMSFEITDGERKIDISIRNSDVLMSQSVFEKRLTADQVLAYIEAIYTEQHSFIDNAEGIKKLRADIKTNKESIKRLQAENVKLEKQIADALALKGSK